MTTKAIKKDDSSFVMTTNKPTAWGYDGTITIDIFDSATGTQLVDGGLVTSYAGDTLAADAAAGTFNCTLTTGNTINSGQLVAIGSDVDGWQIKEVDGYSSSTKILSFKTGLQEAVISGSSVKGLELSYTLDASGAEFSGVDECAVWWISSTDDITHIETWPVMGIRSDVAGLENEFRIAFQNLHTKIPIGDFEHYEARARSYFREQFESKQKDFDRIVDSESLRELMLIEIALMLGITSMEQDIYDRLVIKRNDLFTTMMDNGPWSDDDEDGQKGEEETQVGAIPFRRGIF